MFPPPASPLPPHYFSGGGSSNSNAGLLIFSLLFPLLHGGGSSSSSSSNVEFDFGTLTLSSLKLIGDAHIINNTVRLTPDLAVPTSGAGRALYSHPVRFLNQESNTPTSFTSFFTFSISNLNPSSIGGGLAFLLVPDSTSIGGSGGFLGLKEGSSSSSSSNGFVAVEFDTLMDVEFKDINGNHVGLDLNEMVSSESGDLGSVEVDLKSGNSINAWIEFDGSTGRFNVSVSYSNLKPDRPFLSFNLELESYVSEFMFVGFSGSTQGSTESHTVEWWSFNSWFDSESPTPPTNETSEMTHPPPPAAAFAPVSDNGSHSIQSKKNSCQNNSLCKKGPIAVAGVATAGAFCCLALFGGVLIWLYSKKLKSPSSSLASDVIKSPKEFPYKELKSATKNFDSTRIIGHGAFGTVYKGILPETGDIVAVKRCSHNGTQGKTEFLSELSIIGTLRHRNLVRLQGYCHEKGEILLVYELMCNGSLDKALYESSTVLSWVNRKKILLGVASALVYLHQECENQVIHRDVKASNIMLDEVFNARLGDFGLARQIEHDKSPNPTIAAGTMGYLAPEYLLTGRASDKTDVFSFGAVVLEVASGRRPIEKGGGDGSLVDWVWGFHREGRVVEVADKRLEGEFEESEMRRVLMIGLACSHPDPLVRPAMRSVVQMLGGEAQVPVVPRNRPSSMSFTTSQLLFNLQDTVSDCNATITISSPTSSSSSTNLIMAEQLV